MATVTITSPLNGETDVGTWSHSLQRLTVPFAFTVDPVSSNYPATSPGDVIGWKLYVDGVEKDSYWIIDSDHTDHTGSAILEPSTSYVWRVDIAVNLESGYEWQTGANSSFITAAATIIASAQSICLGSDGNVIVIGSTSGVFISFDFGSSWIVKYPTGEDDNQTFSNVACSCDGTYIYAGIQYGELYRSADGGSSWTELDPAEGDTWHVIDIAMSNDGQFVVVVGGTSTKSCFLSTDYGVTWTEKYPEESINWDSCDISNDGRIIIVTDYDGPFYLSTDFGTTWEEQIAAATDDTWMRASISGDGGVGLIAASFEYNNEVFIGTSTELYSEATWEESTLTPVGRSILDDADVAAQVTTLGLGIGDSPTFTGLTLSGLTSKRLVASGSALNSVEDLSTWIAGITNQIVVTGDGDGTVTLSTPQDIDSGASPTFDGLISTGVVRATDFAKTGWPVTPGVTLSFVGGTTRTFTVTDGGSAYYYIDGVKYTLGGNKTVVIDDIEGLWYIYFDGATLTASQTIWRFVDENKVLVSFLYWARDVGTPANGKAIIVGWELHSFHMSGATHARLHYAGGARWETGLLVADAGSEDINVSAGDIWDEDLNIPISDGAGSALFEQILSPAQLPIYYRDGASAWRIYETNEKAALTDVGYLTGGNLKYNDPTTTWSNETVGLNNYVAYYVIATNEQTKPIALIMGQRIDNKLSDAKVNNVFSGLSLAGLPFEEMVVLARLILKDTATYTLEEVLDLRAYNIKGNITSPLITQHAGLGGLAFADAGHSGFQAQTTYVTEYGALDVIS